VTVTVAIPVYRINCNVVVERVRAWSVAEELLLWSLSTTSQTIGDLVKDSNLPHQVIVASLARLMRFRLVELCIKENAVQFQCSKFGKEIIASGEALPTFPKRFIRPVGFVVDRFSGHLFQRRDIRFQWKSQIQKAISAGTDIRKVSVEGGAPSTDDAAQFTRLSEIVARRLDDSLAAIDRSSFSFTDDGFMTVRVADGIPRDLPDTASDVLKNMILDVAKRDERQRPITISYAGQTTVLDTFSAIACDFDPADLVIGGDDQQTHLHKLMEEADARVIVHSSFVDAEKFRAQEEVIKAACRRHVTVDIMWGIESNRDLERRNHLAILEIAEIVNNDPVMRDRVRVHLERTGSHAKVILADTRDGRWIAAVGSCNWLYSPFKSIELSVILRAPAAVADVLSGMQRLIGEKGIAHPIAVELGITARDLRRLPPSTGNSTTTLVMGREHESIMRLASGSATARFVVGSNRLGSTARPGALIPSKLAASREGVSATVLYSRPSGPIKHRHAKELALEAQKDGVKLIKTKSSTLHGKFVLWGDNDVLITSLNWASASSDPLFPLGEMGVHVSSPGLASLTLRRLESIFPELLT
jgi:cardiolipin synthase A/B